MKIQFRLLLETVALTALIWTYADQASYETYSSVVAVRIDAPPDVVARISLEGAKAGSDVVHIPLKLKGPKAAIRKLEMEKGGGAFPFMLKLPLPDAPKMNSSYTMDIRDNVARLPAIHSQGLKLEELSHPNIEFTLDRYVSKTLIVEADPGKFGDALDGKPLVQPKQVIVKVLESELNKRTTQPEQRLVIPIEERLRARAEEFAATFEVPLGSKWEGMDAAFKPDQVRVTIRLARLYERVHLTLIPLRVMLPPGVFAGDYQTEWQTDADLVQDIDVRVPVGKPRALTNTEVLAFIQIEKSDLPPESPVSPATAPAGTEGWSQREIHFVFPQGFEDVQVDGPPRTIKFRIKPQTTPNVFTPLTDSP